MTAKAKKIRNYSLITLAFLIPAALSFWAAIEVPYGWSPGEYIIILLGMLFAFGLAYGMYLALQEESFRDGYLDILTLIGIAAIALVQVVLKFLGIIIAIELVRGLFTKRRR